MTFTIYGIAYLAVIIFVSAVLFRIVSYISKPMHVRWELYPVAHEGERASYGGGYLEEVDWWEKEREKSLIGELIYMIKEILFLKAVWENNRTLWYQTYAFHIGIYLSAASLLLLLLAAILKIANFGYETIIINLINIICPIGMIAGIIGAVSLFLRRIYDTSLRNYSSFEHFFNLFIFILTMILVLINWGWIDPSFAMAIGFITSIITFTPAPIENVFFTLQVLMASFLIAYIPLTHMSHFFMKYFLYHDIRWGDEPNVNNPKTESKINVVLNYNVSWSAPHIAGHGKNTWAEVATFNPMAVPEKKKE